jgi:D-alanine--poly(phosphoribitol) ligase subunit 2
MSIREIIQAQIATLAKAPVPEDPDASLFESGVIDSWGVMELVGQLEEELGVKVPDADMIPRKFETVNRIVTYFEEKRGA